MSVDVSIRPVIDSDLDRFFEFQRDPEAVRMAAFTPDDPDDRSAFYAHWARVRANPRVVNRTVVLDGEVVGNAATYPDDGILEVTYWVDREHWGRGIASKALSLLIEETPERPLRARAVSDNLGSLRVLQKAGFVVINEQSDFAPGRGERVVELILQLD
ncbi:MAG: putative acetyltransferase [Rhodoglobus sp.]|nr:putative acetyltransferase [Rhodoglobus sp.]